MKREEYGTYTDETVTKHVYLDVQPVSVGGSIGGSRCLKLVVHKS